MEIVTQEIKADIDTYVTTAKTLVIADGMQYESASELAFALDDRIKKIESLFDPHVKRAHEAHKALLADKKSKLAPAEQALTQVKAAMNRFRDEERRRAAEESRRLAEIARRKEEELRLAEAEELERIAKTTGYDVPEDIIHDILDAPMPVADTKVEAFIPKVSGVVERIEWKWEFTDKSLIPKEYMIVDEKAIGAMVRARKGETQIPGIRVYSESATTMRR